ncbi:SEFIR domain-containing protein [Meridianimaribacter flavus]|uniref:SEFIR domain-containing protein n=2 Tax=Meridianimaribacter flavus TaxID=571115 RepID=A0ABY2G6H7_9FLAO|nr:SEFIR domain-containing protein [Meridianimaribacter flavus]
MSDGIEVIIDKWDLKEGHDMFDFMESMVKSPEINKVLVILDKTYSEKADSRSGGVGTETQIISPNVYKNASQEKFIPIVTERDEEGNAFIPTYFDGRIYIDLSSNEHFEENYEKLLRNIYQRPSFQKPKIGTPPKYLFEETPKSYKTSQILRTFDYQIDKYPKRINSIIRDFLDVFYNNLKDFAIEFEVNDYMGIGKQICDNIHQYTDIRNDFLDFIDKLTKLEIEFDFDIVINFLEKLPLLENPDESRSSWSQFEFDNFRIINHELLIYLVAIGLKNENYGFVEDVLYSTYFFKDRHNNYNNEPKTFDELYRHVDSIDKYYKETYSKNFFNPMADLIIKRIPENMDKSDFVQADLLCYYVANMNGKRWFPQTYVYDSRSKKELFYKMVSKKHFNKVKGLFDVKNIDEMKYKLNELKEKESQNGSYNNRIGYSSSFDRVLPLYDVIEIEKIGTTR